MIDGKEEDARIKQLELTVIGPKFVEDILSNNIVESNLSFISILARIPSEELNTFIKVASKVTTELIGPKFTDWAYKAADTIKKVNEIIDLEKEIATFLEQKANSIIFYHERREN